MASASDLAAERKGPTWVVGPTEDVVQALMETLVDPLLPLRVSNEPQSKDAHISVSRQMHAVVLLYNYYHRKQKPELAFLDFEYFCKLVVVLRPPMIAFMKLFKESELMELNGADGRLSETEEAIKYACDIAATLDASRNFPTIEGWRISKVAVLLIDSKRENCFLQFGAITEGTWSLIEKELNESSCSPRKIGNKSQRDIQYEHFNDTTDLLQLGYDAVKDLTGIDCDELEVLETHTTYSSSTEKSTACLYIMQYSGSFSLKEQVRLKPLVESLQSPLAEKLADGFWRTTLLVKYHHILPYVEFISCWLSRNDSSVPSLRAQESRMNHENLDNKIDEHHKNSASDPARGLQTMDNEDMRKKLHSKTKVYHRRRNKSSTKQDECVQEDADNFKVDTVDASKLHGPECRDEKLMGGEGDITMTCSEDRIAVTENHLIQCESKYDVTEEEEVEKENALALLYSKMQELHSEICSMQDTRALCDDYITRIRDGGDDDLAREYITLTESGKNPFLSEQESQVHDKAHNPGQDDCKSSCEELDSICLKNNWRTPRYFIELSDGKFISTVTIKKRDIELISSKGGLESTPREARESAASQIIAKLKSSSVTLS